MLCLSHHGWWFLNFFHHITFHRILIALCLCCSYVLMLTKSVLKYMHLLVVKSEYIRGKMREFFFHVLQIFSSIFFTLSGFWTLALVVVAQCNMRRQYNILYLFFFVWFFYLMVNQVHGFCIYFLLSSCTVIWFE